MFYCSICAESSINICVHCTKDACGNHICERCLCCSDCCKCEFHEGKDPMAMALPGNVRPFFEPYDAAIEAQESRAAHDARLTELEAEPNLELESEGEESVEGEPASFPAIGVVHPEPHEIQGQD